MRRIGCVLADMVHALGQLVHGRGGGQRSVALLVGAGGHIVGFADQQPRSARHFNGIEEHLADDGRDAGHQFVECSCGSSNFITTVFGHAPCQVAIHIGALDGRAQFVQSAHQAAFKHKSEHTSYGQQHHDANYRTLGSRAKQVGAN